jgi:hypothetical protein
VFKVVLGLEKLKLKNESLEELRKFFLNYFSYASPKKVEILKMEW